MLQEDPSIYSVFWYVTFLKSELWSSNNIVFFPLDLKPFKNVEKCSLFHLKISFRSQDI